MTVAEIIGDWTEGLFEIVNGEAWAGPAIALLQEMNTIWMFEITGGLEVLTDEDRLMRSAFLEMMNTIEGGLRFGWWEEDAAEKIMAGAAHLDKFPGYGDQRENIALILADIKDDLR